MSLGAWISMLTYLGVALLIAWKLVFVRSARRSMLGFVAFAAWIWLPIMLAPKQPPDHALEACLRNLKDKP